MLQPGYTQVSNALVQFTTGVLDSPTNRGPPFALLALVPIAVVQARVGRLATADLGLNCGRRR